MTLTVNATAFPWSGVHRGRTCPGCDLCVPRPTFCYWGQHDIEPDYDGELFQDSHLRCVPLSELRGADRG